MNTPNILIIIVTWNKKEYVLDLLESVKKLVYKNECIQILMIDNASTDGTVEAVSDNHPDVTLVCNEENLGGTGGFNTGLEWAFNQPDGKFDYLWLLDNDVVVNQRALIELVDLLEKTPDAAIAGSSMMQLDYPWRINEIGSFYKKDTGTLILNFHGLPVESLRGRSIEELASMECDLSNYITDFKSDIDVDYVAAASLLIRADVAKKAGIWKDFFIHFDDVEWCLRIAGMGYRVLASCRSIIWHMSAAAKVSTWMLYYDIRNSLKVIETHGLGPKSVDQAVNLEFKRAFYYALIGRMELANLVIEAVDDFKNSNVGKKDIKFPSMFNHQEQDLKDLPFMDKKVNRVLIPWTINMYATGLQEILVRAKKQRPELVIDFMTVPGGLEIYQFPESTFKKLSGKRLYRFFEYLSLRNKYDLVLQSEYERIPVLSWLGEQIMFLSNTSYCLRSSPKLSDLTRFLKQLGFKRFKLFGYSKKNSQ